MPEQYKQHLQTMRQKVVDYLGRLRDVRTAGQLLFVIIVLLVSWSGIKAIDANFSLQKQIAGLQQKNSLQQLENSNLQLQNDYYNSQQYLELSARQNFGLAQPGEKELLVPQSVAMSYILPTPKLTPSTASNRMPFYERNMHAWLNFFLHRKQSN
jgi:cell division protein FtsB